MFVSTDEACGGGGVLVLALGLRIKIGVFDSGPCTGALAARNIAILSATEPFVVLPSGPSTTGVGTGGDGGGGMSVGPTLLRRSAAILSLTVGAALAVVSDVTAPLCGSELFITLDGPSTDLFDALFAFSAAILSAIETLGGSLVADPGIDSAVGAGTVDEGETISSALFALLKAARSEMLDRRTGGSGVLVWALFAFSSSSFCFIMAMRSFTDIGADMLASAGQCPDVRE